MGVETSTDLSSILYPSPYDQSTPDLEVASLVFARREIPSVRDIRLVKHTSCCHTNRSLKRLIQQEKDMDYITKGLIGVAALSFLLADGLANWTLIFSGESFSLIFNNLFAVVAIALMLVARRLTT